VPTCLQHGYHAARNCLHLSSRAFDTCVLAPSPLIHAIGYMLRHLCFVSFHTFKVPRFPVLRFQRPRPVAVTPFTLRYKLAEKFYFIAGVRVYWIKQNATFYSFDVRCFCFISSHVCNGPNAAHTSAIQLRCNSFYRSML